MLTWIDGENHPKQMGAEPAGDRHDFNEPSDRSGPYFPPSLPKEKVAILGLLSVAYVPIRRSFAA